MKHAEIVLEQVREGALADPRGSEQEDELLILSCLRKQEGCWFYQLYHKANYSKRINKNHHNKKIFPSLSLI